MTREVKRKNVKDEVANDNFESRDIKIKKEVQEGQFIMKSQLRPSQENFKVPIFSILSQRKCIIPKRPLSCFIKESGVKDNHLIIKSGITLNTSLTDGWY
eukprot:snap_masked-scaffold_10-processed-gene-8.27-mRNA-1 protein AED:1.00 eAED:1.00 QI:0/-1/0/0/-1/1/1/0/99